MTIINKNELMENFIGDEEILKDLIEEFLKKVDSLLLNVEKAIQDNNAKDLNLHAHTFKGVISNFYCEELRMLAYELEKFGANNKLENAHVILSKIQEKLPHLKTELKILSDSL